MRFHSSPSREHARPRDYFSRREQYRMLALVFALGLVVVAMRKAAQPATWVWLFGDDVPTLARDAAGPQEDVTVDTRRVMERTLPAGVFRVEREPAVNSGDGTFAAFPGVRTTWLEALRDDTVFRSSEVDAWYGMLAIVRDATPDQFATHTLGAVGFTQLYRQPNVYRGRAVRLSGVVKRCHHIEAHDNSQGIEKYFRCWLWPRGSVNPVVVYCLEIPLGFPTGMSINENVSVNGLFYKRWAYTALEDIRIAPLVVARTVDWPLVDTDAP